MPGKLFKLSAQQFVSCAPNVPQCGGTGGCEGASHRHRRRPVQSWLRGCITSASPTACSVIAARVPHVGIADGLHSYGREGASHRHRRRHVRCAGVHVPGFGSGRLGAFQRYVAHARRTPTRVPAHMCAHVSTHSRSAIEAYATSHAP